MLKWMIQQGNITIINEYEPSIRASKHKKQKLTALKGKIESSIVIVRNCNMLLSATDRKTRQKTART